MVQEGPGPLGVAKGNMAYAFFYPLLGSCVSLSRSASWSLSGEQWEDPWLLLNWK